MAGEAPILRVEGLSGNGFSDVSFTAGKGEIVGVAGVVGNGQTALLRALAGLERSTGSVTSPDGSSHGARCSSAPPTCRPTGSPRA